MILLELTYNGTTKYMCDYNSRRSAGRGITLDGNFYKPSLLNQPNINLSGKALIKARALNVNIKRDDINDFGDNQLTATIYLWSEKDSDSKFIVFKGNAVRTAFDSNQYTYKLDTKRYNLDNNLLTDAPNLKADIGNSDSFTDKRVYPMNFGYVKYVAPLQLAVLCGAGCSEYSYIDGKVTNAYDGGVDGINYEQPSDTTVKVNGAATTYDFLVDVDAVSGGTGLKAGQKKVTRINKVVRLSGGSFSYPSNMPDIDDYGFIDGDIFINGDDDNTQYLLNGSTWSIFIDERSKLGLNTDGQITQILKGANLPSTGQGNGLNATQSHMGYFDGTNWNAVIQSNGQFYFGDGGTKVGTNNFLSYTGGNFVISTNQFQVDSLGNATLSGSLTASNWNLDGDYGWSQNGLILNGILLDPTTTGATIEEGDITLSDTKTIGFTKTKTESFISSYIYDNYSSSSSYQDWVKGVHIESKHIYNMSTTASDFEHTIVIPVTGAAGSTGEAKLYFDGTDLKLRIGASTYTIDKT